MPDDWGPIRELRRRLPWIDPTADADRTSVVSTLVGADLLSLVALFFAWVATLLFVGREPNWAIVAMIAAFVFDKLDGSWARYRGTDSDLGRRIDSYVDVFVYLVTAALLFDLELSPHVGASVVVGFAILAIGGLRLVRHTVEGFTEIDQTKYYHGTTVVHTNAVVVANYLLVALTDVWNGWLAALTIVLACPLMISDYRAPKSTGAHRLVAVLGVLVVAVVLAIEFGWLPN
ncbi:CDP-alcohol phosphatidyltransferase family protein [Halococcoides cellulosivorans]|uniref:Phosphatidylserine synthase n=1 Tax=Halococcoides cellulosivorans TaxID=1679096 RepID=A0A2R4X238_9EURY|nr:CDP-alcohol phosphatidyltransferase family protein [Halococcoides cellulosivorans]AWB27869.1 phosphatidylserine synthase [Halococcoides cellulosivorans]